MKKLQLLALSMLLSTSMTFTEGKKREPQSGRTDSEKGPRLTTAPAKMSPEEKAAFVQGKIADAKDKAPAKGKKTPHNEKLDGSRAADSQAKAAEKITGVEIAKRSRSRA